MHLHNFSETCNVNSHNIFACLYVVNSELYLLIDKFIFIQEAIKNIFEMTVTECSMKYLFVKHVIQNNEMGCDFLKFFE